jgi:TRAP-type C4-dicarboxylate transport system permease small subunit
MQSVEKIAVAFQDQVVIIASIGMVLMICLTVVLRYFFETDLYAIDEFETICAFWLYFIGAAYASYTRKQITADILNFVIQNKRVKKTILIVSSFLTFAVCCVFTVFSLDLFAFAFGRSQKTLIWQIPMTVTYAAIVLGFILMSAYNFRDLRRNMKLKTE